MLDEGRIERGHRLLGAWLDDRSGSGSDWIHLQWHMAVFELARGDWDSAFARFRKHILPATATEDALTDAPALLWRLSLAASQEVDLPWEPLRARALLRMRRLSDPFVEVHNLLALAGAGDIESIARWLRRRALAAGGRKERLVTRVAMALKAYAARDYHEAARVLAGVMPYLSEIGGSRAQRQLFEAIERECRRKAGQYDSWRLHPEAA
jgi:hypothetical protein